MNIFVYSDESSVFFDKAHNDIFVFGGLILLGKEEKEICARKYCHAESVIRKNATCCKHVELKASMLSGKEKGKLFRALNSFYKFAVVVHQKQVLDRIFESKKDKQRYLDFAYKVAIKRALQNIANKIYHIAIESKTRNEIYTQAQKLSKMLITDLP